MQTISDLNEVNIQTPEGRLLMAALAKLTTSEWQHLTPGEAIKELNERAGKMYTPASLNTAVQLDKARHTLAILQNGVSAMGNMSTATLRAMVDRYDNDLKELDRLRQIESMEPETVGPKQPAVDTGIFNHHAESSERTVPERDTFNPEAAKQQSAGIYIYSMHEKEPFKNPENHCIISKETLDHLLNCLDNQKYNPTNLDQKIIDEANYLSRISLKTINQRDEPRQDAGCSTNGQDKKQALPTITINAESINRMVEVRARSQRLIHVIKQNNLRHGLLKEEMDSLEESIIAYDHATGSSL